MQKLKGIKNSYQYTFNARLLTLVIDGKKLSKIQLLQIQQRKRYKKQKILLSKNGCTLTKIFR